MLVGSGPSTENDAFDMLSFEICIDEEPGFEIETC
jgi:hypothetical protein